ncbi:pilus assembly PilX N-terminal domain-containing protein [Candidatus Microgenomates bacterium]|nr:pilus assembly PilX N-terminal domain-containing protein [Candidatus Microgenomates bacterium]
MSKESGQIILTIILVMAVVLAVGLSIIQKSLIDVSTSTKVEQSSRAFSAAEAGIEKALKGTEVCGTDCIQFSDNSSKADVLDSGLKPDIPSPGIRQDPLESDPLAKEEITQVWLADYTSVSNPPALFYNPPSPDPGRKLEVYWGNSSTDKAALELTMVYYNGSQFSWRKWYLDQISRTPANGFCQVATCGGGYTVGSNTYQCKKVLGDSTCPNINTYVNDDPLPSNLMAVRARLLYNSSSQPFAVWAVGTCGSGCSLPRQKKEIISIGTSGDTQRKVKVSQILDVVPFYFDYAIFSAGEIKK